MDQKVGTLPGLLLIFACWCLIHGSFLDWEKVIVSILNTAAGQRE